MTATKIGTDHCGGTREEADSTESPSACTYASCFGWSSWSSESRSTSATEGGTPFLELPRGGGENVGGGGDGGGGGRGGGWF